MPVAMVVDDSPVDRVLVQGLLKRDATLSVSLANDGADALARFAVQPPDVVVTDLQMPEMDGLQLVTALRIHYPNVPVVLITAHGSEELAIAALERGAASYVPKSQLNDRLLESVQQVLALAQSDRSYLALTECMEHAAFDFKLGDDPSLYERLVELVQTIAVSMGLCDVAGQVRLGMALEEALSYTMLRGNYELTESELQEVHLHSDAGLRLMEERRCRAPYRDRRLQVAVRLSPVEARIAIMHEGTPIPAPSLPAPGTSPELEAAGNRSLVLMTAFLDVVEFKPNGRELVLIKRKPA
jgi:CheY-like chemotaxis protein